MDITVITNYGEQIAQAAVAIILVTALCVVFVRVFTPSKSSHYRGYLTNLYVAAKIRQLSKNDDIDLGLEELHYLKYIKESNKRSIRELDEKIESELMEKVEEDINKTKSKSKD